MRRRIPFWAGRPRPYKFRVRLSRCNSPRSKPLPTQNFRTRRLRQQSFSPPRTARLVRFCCAQTVNCTCRFHAFLFPLLARLSRATDLYRARFARARSGRSNDTFRSDDACRASGCTRSARAATCDANFAADASADFADRPTASARAAQHDATFDRQRRANVGSALANYRTNRRSHVNRHQYFSGDCARRCSHAAER